MKDNQQMRFVLALILSGPIGANTTGKLVDSQFVGQRCESLDSLSFIASLLQNPGSLV